MTQTMHNTNSDTYKIGFPMPLESNYAITKVLSEALKNGE